MCIFGLCIQLTLSAFQDPTEMGQFSYWASRYLPLQPNSLLLVSDPIHSPHTSSLPWSSHAVTSLIGPLSSACPWLIPPSASIQSSPGGTSKRITHSLILLSSPLVINVHSMQTRSKSGISKPKRLLQFSMTLVEPEPEPTSFTQAFKYSHYK